MLSFTSSTHSARSTRSFSGMSRKEREKIASRDTTLVGQEDDLYRYPTADECRIIRDTWKLISDPNRFRLLSLQLRGNIPPVPAVPAPNPHDATSINTFTSTTQVNPNLNAQLMSISASVSDFPSKSATNNAINNGAPGAAPMRRIPSTRFRDSPYPYPNGGSSTTTSVADDPPGSNFASPTTANGALPISLDEPPPPPIVNPYRHHTMSTFERPTKVPPAPASAPPEQGHRYVVSGGHYRDNSGFSFNVRRDSFGYIPVPAPVSHLINYSAPVPPMPNSHPPSVVSCKLKAMPFLFTNDYFRFVSRRKL
ncbi:hypothetical protein BJ742DRAFT_475505 [Cladochytrium replicatum]|nr:hypothetical protein BJ742DRAFT_475505 [Cladochytrium replicatum]